MKILIISFFYSSNIGDVALSNALYEFYNEEANCERISYMSQPFKYSDPNNLVQKDVVSNLSIKQKIFSILNSFKLENMVYFYYKHKNYYSKTDLNCVIDKINAADIVIIGGGNLVFDLEKMSLSAARLGYLIDLCHKRGKRVALVSIGIGPFVKEIQKEEAVKTILKADYITFRDSKSLKIFNSNCKSKRGLLSSDPAFLIHKLLDRKRDKICINIIDPSFFSETEEQRENIIFSYVNLVNELIEKYGDEKIVLFTTELLDQKSLYEVWKLTNKKTECRMINSLNDLLELYCMTQIVIGSRMHSTILALTQETPVIALSWQQKVYALFDDIGFQEYVYDIFSYEVREVVEKLELVLSMGENRIQKEIRLMLKREKQKLGVNKIRSIKWGE